jgi:restriction system protein
MVSCIKFVAESSFLFESPMKNYYRIMLGRKSVDAEECFRGSFIGVDFGIEQDVTSHLSDNQRDFNRQFIPVYLKNRPTKSKIAAGLACSAVWTVARGIQIGDIVLSPNGSGSYLVGEVNGAYSYHPREVRPHRRPVRWYPQTIERSAMSKSMQNSTGSIGTISNITKFAEEIARLIGNQSLSILISTDETVEDPSVFALEKHLEDFLVQNWKQTELGKTHDIFQEDDEFGQQYPTDTGEIDILAISKDKKELLVVELKKGRASDSVVGQIQRYMGYVVEELAENGQTVRGVIIALEDDPRIRRALAVAPNIGFYRYQVSFKLFKA